MSVLDWLILAAVAALIVLAIRVWHKSGSCSCSSGSCCGNCSACGMDCKKKKDKKECGR